MEELPRLLGQRLVEGELELFVDMRYGEPRWVPKTTLERRGQEMRWAIEQHLARPENRTLLEMAPSADDSTHLQPTRGKAKRGFLRKRGAGGTARAAPPDNDEAEEESFVAQQQPPPLPLPPTPAPLDKTKENDLGRTANETSKTILSRFKPRNK